MKRHIFLLLSVIIFIAPVSSLYSQINKYGTPVIKNYNIQQTGGSTQNWWITKDTFGSVYFANDEKGVIKYDGSTWSSIPIRNNARVRSLGCDDDGIIYVGGAYEFGYIEPGTDGAPMYISLSERYEQKLSVSDNEDGANKPGTEAQEPVIDFGEITSVATRDSLVFFLSPTKYLFVYNNVTGAMKYLDIKNLGFSRFERVFHLYDRIILCELRMGLYEYKNGEIVPLPKGDFFGGIHCMAMMPYEEGKVVIGAFEGGAYIYDYVNGIVNDRWVDESVASRLVQIYCGAQLPSGDYAFGTISSGDGVYVIDRNGKLTGCWNTERTDLEDNNIYAMYSGTDNNELWIATYGTISKVYTNLAFTQFSSVSGIVGGTNSVCELDNIIYVATDNGVIRSRTDEHGLRYFEPVEGVYEQVFPVVSAKVGNESFVLAGGLLDLYQIRTGKAASRIRDMSVESSDNEGATYTTWCITQSRIDPHRFYFGSQTNGVSVVDYINGKWKKAGKIVNMPGTVTSQVELDNGDLLVQTEPPNALYKVRLSDSVPFRYGPENGLPDGRISRVERIGDEVVISTSNGLYKYLQNTNSWVSYNEVAGGYSAGKNINYVFEDGNKDIWLDLSEAHYSAIMLQKSDSQITAYRNQFQPLPNVGIMSASFIEDRVWLAMSKNVFVIDKQMLKIPDPKPLTLITKIMVGSDSLFMNGSFFRTTEDGRRIPTHTYGGNGIPEIKYNLNSLSFYWTTPYFVEEDLIQYSYRLDGFSNEWSRWENISYKEFTNLSFGKYTFRVRARTINQIESSEAVFEFIVLKPWYLKTYMIILYVIVFVLAILGIISAYTKKLKNENIRLEGIVAERTAVVVKQKEELESSIHYARRIQMALLPSESIISENLKNYFILFKPRDIVSGDFYWMTKKANRLYIVAADCTGHGVPGAFMSLLGMSFLDEIIDKEKAPRADFILSELRLHVTESLKQSGGDDEAKDGMDLALLVIDYNKSRIEFSGAYNPCFRIRKMTDEEKKLHQEENMEMPDGSMTDGTYLLETIYASKMPIGISSRMNENFVFHDWDLEKGVSYYLFSDGYIDQFGGANGRKFMKKNFKRLLLEIQDYPMKKQKELLDQNLKEWMGESPQIDDILVMGIRTD